MDEVHVRLQAAILAAADSIDVWSPYAIIGLALLAVGCLGLFVEMFDQ